VSLPPHGALAALDPGRSKCGLVRTDPGRSRIAESLVLGPEAASERLRRWIEERRITAVLIGNGTGSAPWTRRLADLVPVVVVEERGTTLAARTRYWELFPARGWRRLLPAGMRQPPRDWDDVVAQVLIERALGHPLGAARSAPAP
jgi:RNase H-fold protein (predicted Holliday junction resolvase)